eukprot:scaffold17582_cov23-Tisochrysis_lutea.AAC.2
MNGGCGAGVLAESLCNFFGWTVHQHTPFCSHAHTASDVVNTQRDRIYAERRRAVLTADLSPFMIEYAEKTADDIVEQETFLGASWCGAHEGAPALTHSIWAANPVGAIIEAPWILPRPFLCAEHNPGTYKVPITIRLLRASPHPCPSMHTCGVMHTGADAFICATSTAFARSVQQIEHLLSRITCPCPTLVLGFTTIAWHLQDSIGAHSHIRPNTSRIAGACAVFTANIDREADPSEWRLEVLANKLVQYCVLLEGLTAEDLTNNSKASAVQAMRSLLPVQG